MPLESAETRGVGSGIFAHLRYGFVWLVCLALCAGCAGGQSTKQAAPRKVYHRVERGQTLWSIARTYGVELRTLARTNKLSDTDVLQIGQKLYIPGARQWLQVVSRCPCGSSTSSRATQGSSRATSSRPLPQCHCRCFFGSAGGYCGRVRYSVRDCPGPEDGTTRCRLAHMAIGHGFDTG